MNLNELTDLYIEQLKDLYSAESQIIEALPKMAKGASSPELKSAFEEHLEMTKRQKQRLEQIFEGLEYSPRGKRCVGMEGIIKEGDELLKKKEIDSAVRDAALIAAAQHVEHYEIAGYGTVAAWAQQLGRSDEATLLHQTLEEEEQTDKRLTRLAESQVNVEAQA